jgi:hypothetical protein
MLRLYRVLCYTKLVLDQIVYINPYIWPFSIFKFIVGPYFRFWSELFPTKPFRKYGIYFSGLVALEVLNIITRLFGVMLHALPAPQYF